MLHVRVAVTVVDDLVAKGGREVKDDPVAKGDQRVRPSTAVTKKRKRLPKRLPKKLPSRHQSLRNPCSTRMGQQSKRRTARRLRPRLTFRRSSPRANSLYCSTQGVEPLHRQWLRRRLSFMHTEVCRSCRSVSRVQSTGWFWSSRFVSEPSNSIPKGSTHAFCIERQTEADRNKQQREDR